MQKEIEEKERGREADLIRECQNGKKASYSVLVNKYMKRAYFTALGLAGSHEAALDLSQEAFVRGFRAIKRFDPERRFFTWYYQILRNLCFNFLRDTKRRAQPFSEVGEFEIAKIASFSNPESDFEKIEIQEIVWRGIQSLRENEREIIVMKDFQEMSYKEIAETLECPIGTVMSRLYTARRALKTELENILA